MSASKKETSSLHDADTSEEDKKDHCIDFHGATYFNNAGEEVEITEEMVENACQSVLDKTSRLP